VGAKLAREGGAPITITVEFQSLIASKLCSHSGLQAKMCHSPLTHSRASRQGGSQAASARLLIADAPLTTMPKRRHCEAAKPGFSK